MKMNPTPNTLPPRTRQSTVQLLNSSVAELLDPFARIKPAHSNLRGLSFIGLHKLLDGFASTTLDEVDAAAERATALGGVVDGTLREAVKQSRLKRKEEPASCSGQSEWLDERADAQALASEHVRKAIKKFTKLKAFGTADLLTNLLNHSEKQLWMREALLVK